MKSTTAWTPSSQTFVCRTPLLPFEAFRQWGDSLPAARLALLRDWMRQPLVRESLRLSSPSLEQRVDLWLNGQLKGDAQAVLDAVVRYFTRMSTRATPFGLCAAYSLGTLSDATRLTLAPADSLVRHVRLDSGFAAALAGFVRELPDVKAGCTWTHNTSLHPAGPGFRLMESTPGAQGRAFRLVTLADSPHLRCVLAAAAQGAATLAGLADGLLDFDPTLGRDDAEGYLEELVTHQVLISNVQVPLTGQQALPALRGSISGAIGSVPAWFDDLERQLASAASVTPTRESFATLPFEWKGKDLIQVDASRPVVHATIGAGDVAEVARGLEILARLPVPAEQPLSSFVDAFERRYGTRPVPLLQALDEESGVGFDEPYANWASPLLAGLAFPAAPPASTDRPIWALGLLERALSGCAQEVELTEADLAQLPASQSRFSAMMASCELHADGSIHLRGALGPSAGRLLSRFAQDDPALDLALSELLRNEEALEPDAVHAEVVHVPDDRVGNILSRPVARAFEIPLLATSGAASERQIALQDLSVTVVDRQVRLHSRRLGRRVVPHLTTAYNTEMRGNLAIYRFLGAVESQGRCSRLAWSWGALEAASFLPRVVSRRLVLSPARWKLRQSVLRGLEPSANGCRQGALESLRSKLGLPRHVRLVEGDQELLVDLDNGLSVGAFLSASRTMGTVELREDLASQRGLVVGSDGGHCVSELLVPFMPVRRDTAAPSRQMAVRPATPNAQRRLMIGSHCLYVKLYGGRHRSDELLRRLQLPATGWFYVRHADPDPHLRLRFFGDPLALMRELLPMLSTQFAAFERDGLIWKVQIDTYEREIERYHGPEGAAIAEALFCLDSATTLAFLQPTPGPDATWRFAVKSADALLQALGLSEAQRLELVQQQRAVLAQEIGFDAAFEQRASQSYRARREVVDAVLASQPADLQPFESAVRVLADRFRNALDGPLPPSLTSDLLHMHINRIFFEAQRIQEAIVCDHLTRAYRSRLSRARPQRAAGAPALATVAPCGASLQPACPDVEQSSVRINGHSHLAVPRTQIVNPLEQA